MNLDSKLKITNNQIHMLLQAMSTINGLSLLA